MLNQNNRRKNNRYDLTASFYYYWIYENAKSIDEVRTIHQQSLNLSADGAAFMLKNPYDLVEIGDNGTLQIILIDSFINVDFEVVRVLPMAASIAVKFINVTDDTKNIIDGKLITITGRKYNAKTE